MHRSVIIKKRIQNLRNGDIISQSVGKFIRSGYFVDSKVKETLKRHDVLFVSTLKFLDKKDPSEQEIKEHLIEREELYSPVISNLREEIFISLKGIYVPFNETDAIFSSKKGKRQIVDKALFDPIPKELFQSDIDAGSLALIPPDKIILIRNKLLDVYRYFNGFRKKNPDTKGKNRVFPRQNYSSVRLHTIYYESLNKVESLGDDIIWHAVDTALYFLATLANINKIRNAKGKPLSSLRYLAEDNFSTDEEFCYRSDTVVEAGLGSLLAPIGYLHTSYLPIISSRLRFDKYKSLPEETINLLKKASLVGFNLIRNRDDISAIAKLIVRKQTIYQNGEGQNYLKDSSILHEFVRLYQVINTYDCLIHPFLAKEPASREDVISYLLKESSPYDSLRERRYDRKMLKEFLNILAPYEPLELIYLVDKKDSSSPLYRGFVINYNNDSTTPLISLLYDYKNQKEFKAGELIFDLPSQQIFILQDGKITKHSVADKLRNLKMFDFNLSPLNNLGDYRNPILD